MLKKIPYGITDYELIRKEAYYYVDKTRFLRLVEEAGRYLFVTRPRRFGKSLWLVVLESYYDCAAAADFDALFAETEILAAPTPERNAYLILKFNFSGANPDPREIEASFTAHVENQMFFFGKKYRELLEDDYFEMMAKPRGIYEKLEFLLQYVGAIGKKVYLLIDEYDNFANSILATHGEEAYQRMTHGAGFFRYFFNVLKEATTARGAGLGRLFIAGVSPVTMDDVTSGFNIGRNLSLDVRFNELLGFTRQEMRVMLEYYAVVPDIEETLDLMADWYDHYRFAPDAAETVFNADMALYFVQHLAQSGRPPAHIADENVKIDYRKLRHLLILDRKLNGNFSQLTAVVGQGEISAEVAPSFPVERLTKPENFLSLLFYFGLLTYKAAHLLAIPNLTMKSLLYAYLRDAYDDVNVFRLDVWKLAELIRRMAYHGEWEAVFRFLAGEIERQTSIRDYLDGEKVAQTFLLAYLNVSDLYLTRSEAEMGKGFADILLEPFRAKYPEIAYRYVIELKYIERGHWSEKTFEKARQEAREQLRQYAADAAINDALPTVLLALVFCGWELKLIERVE